MKTIRNGSIITVLILALFVVNVSAGPLNSFEQNPIPYWDDNSGYVDITWDSSDQIVMFENEDISGYNGSVYYHDGSNLDDVAFDAKSGAVGEGEYGIASVDGAIEVWIDLDSAADEYVVYKMDFTDIDNSDGDYNLSMRYKVENQFFHFYAKLYYDDASWDDIVPTTSDSLTWEIFEIDCDSGKVLDYIAMYSNDIPSTTSSGNYSTYVDDVAIRSGLGNLDIGIPITTQDQQTVELYVNSTFLTSEVRLEIYDDTEALGTYCVFNSSYVIFPDDNYAQTDGLSRIEFSLNNERNTGTITVYAENSTLINQYETSILSGTNLLRMIDSVFNGSIILYYLNGDAAYTPEFSIIDELFLSTSMIGYIGPLLLVFAGWFLVKKDKGLGVIAFIVESLFVAQYLALVETTPDYWWQILILIFGMLFTVVFPLWDR